MEIQVKVCDVCREVGRSVKLYSVAAGGRHADVDLCDEHAAPLEALLQSAPVKAAPAPRKKAAASSPRKTTRARRKPEVVSFSDIERMKAE